MVMRSIRACLYTLIIETVTRFVNIIYATAFRIFSRMFLILIYNYALKKKKKLQDTTLYNLSIFQDY